MKPTLMNEKSYNARLTAPAFVGTEVVGGTTWTYTVVNGEAVVGGAAIGETAVPKETAGVITIPSELGGCPVVKIGEQAFDDCGKLSGVTISDGVISIDRRAFYGCREMKHLTIPPSVTSIGDDAFGSCKGLGEGVVIVDDCVLTVNDVTSFNEMAIVESILIHGEDFVYDLTDNVENFCTTNSRCPSAVVLPEGVRLIAGGAFAHRSELQQITLPSSLMSIGEGAFSRCKGLTSVIIPPNVTSIGDSAFWWCEGLTSVTIPSSVTSIGEYAFSSCDNLKEVYVAKGGGERMKKLFAEGCRDIGQMNFIEG